MTAFIVLGVLMIVGSYMCEIPDEDPEIVAARKAYGKVDAINN